MATATLPTIANGGSDIDNLINTIIKGVSVSSSAQTSKPGFTGELGTLLDQLVTGTGPYSKEQAIADSSGQIKDFASKNLQTIVPTLSAGVRQAGLYNSTTRELLGNDASARLTSAMADIVQNNIKNYATVQQGNVNAGSAASNAARTTGPQSTGSAIKTALAGPLIGLGLGEAKKYLAKKFADGTTDVTPAINASSGALDYSNFSNNLGSGTSFTTGGPDLDFSDIGSSIVSGLGGSAVDALDFSGVSNSDLSGGFTDNAIDIGSDALSSIGDSVDVSDLADFFFKDGGMVPHYADGGKVSEDSAAKKLLMMILGNTVFDSNAVSKRRMDIEETRDSEPSQKSKPGEIKGKQSSNGQDNINIKAQAGEFILPVDVTEKLNAMAPGFLDGLIEQLHEKEAG